MARIPISTARTVVLRHLPRILRAGLDRAGRTGEVARRLVSDAEALDPELGAAVHAWLDLQSGIGPAGDEPPASPGGTPRSRLVAVIRSLGLRIRPGPHPSTGDCLASLHRLGAASEDTAIHDLADAIAMMGAPASVLALAGRLAASAWNGVDLLPEAGATLHQLALVSSGAQDLDEDAFPEGAVPGLPAGLPDPAAALAAWREALDLAFDELRVEARTLAIGLGALSAGRILDGYGFETLGQFAHRIGRVEVAPLERAAVTVERRSVAVLAAREGARKAAVQRTSAAIERHEPDHEGAVPDGHLMVCRAVQATGAGKGKDVTHGYTHAIGKALPLLATPDLRAVRSSLLSEFPYAEAAIDEVLRGFSGRPCLHAPPFLLEGPPGAGKSRFARRLGEALGTGVYGVDGSNDAGGSYGGTERRWYSSEPCRPFMAIARASLANPIILVDEIDKAPTRSDYGRLWDAMLPALDAETAARFPDPSLQVAIDISWVTTVATANDAGKLPGPLLDRLRVIAFPEPGEAHLAGLLPGLLAAIAAERGLDPGFLLAPDGIELAALRRRWRGGSVRRLRRAVEAVLRSREHAGAGWPQ